MCLTSLTKKNPRLFVILVLDFFLPSACAAAPIIDILDAVCCLESVYIWNLESLNVGGVGVLTLTTIMM